MLKYWQGLGYYSRARNLHAAAKDIMERFDGIFPGRYEDVISLKGIGEYTAAAIVSFVWNQPYPVVDGNVFRVLSRLFAVDTPIDTPRGKKAFTELAGLVMDPRYAGQHNQAIMELGALQCVPQNPDCEACPLKERCAAYGTGDVQTYPVKQKKTKTRDRYFHYLYIIYKGKTWLARRKGKDIWEGLYEFPLIETDKAMDFAELQTTGCLSPFVRRSGPAGCFGGFAGGETCPVPSDPVCDFLPDRDRAGGGCVAAVYRCIGKRDRTVCCPSFDTDLFGKDYRESLVSSA